MINKVQLNADEKHIGVIMSDDSNRVSVKQWSDNGGKITISVFLGDHHWAEAELLPKDAAKVAALIMCKPSVEALGLMIDH